MIKKVRFGHQNLEFPSLELGELQPSYVDEAVSVLKSRMRTDGYLLLKQLIDPAKIRDGREAVLSYMEVRGALTPGTPILEGVMPQNAKHVRLLGNADITYQREVQKVLESEELFAFFQQYFAAEAATFAYKWLRAVGNEEYTGAHYDFVYMGRGSGNLHTVWIPFGDTPVEHGTLCLCEGSNHLSEFARVRDTYGRMDVDRDGVDGWFTKEPMDIVTQFGGRWLTTNYEAGDVILFGMHTMHASTTNLTKRYRLSCDVRFQPAHEPMDERWTKGGPGHQVFGTSAPLRTVADMRAAWGI